MLLCGLFSMFSFPHDTVNILSDLARERIRRAGVKLTSETEMLSDDLDVGFRSLRVSDTNLADILNTPDDLVQTTLEQIVGTIKPGRTPRRPALPGTARRGSGIITADRGRIDRWSRGILCGWRCTDRMLRKVGYSRGCAGDRST